MHIPERIYSLDALRATMMLLGIVLHAAESYSVGVDLLWPKDPNTTSSFFTYLSSFIHIFRMPVFFMISGFFGSLLFYGRGSSKMLKQRFRRIVLPFVVFLTLLHPLIFNAYENLIEALGSQMMETVEFSWLPKITYHLWFLYYLIWITLLVTLLAILLRSLTRLKQVISNLFSWMFLRQWLFLIAFCLTLFVLLVWMWDFWASTPLTFLPDVKVLLFYSLFYLMGWAFFIKQELLSVVKRNGVPYLICGFLIYTLKFIFRDYFDDILYGGLNTISGYLLIFGFTGVFLKFFGDHSSNWRYVSDSSYWVYLIHLPFTLLVPSVVVDWSIPSGVKFLIVVVITSAISLFSYHYFVRGTFIGEFLNGKRYPINDKS